MTADGLKRLLKGRKREDAPSEAISVTVGELDCGDRACWTLLHRLFLRVPKATLDILVSYQPEDLVREVFGLERFFCGKLWWRKSRRNRVSTSQRTRGR